MNLLDLVFAATLVFIIAPSIILIFGLIVHMMLLLYAELKEDFQELRGNEKER